MTQGRPLLGTGCPWARGGLKRARSILRSFGFDVSGALDLEPNDLRGLSAWVEVENEEREGPSSGQSVVRPKVPFPGYADANLGGFSGRLVPGMS